MSSILCLDPYFIKKVIHAFYFIVYVQISGWWEEPVNVLANWKCNTRETGDQWMILTGPWNHLLSCAESLRIADLPFQQKGVLVLQINQFGRFHVLDLSLHWGSVESQRLILPLTDWRWSVQVTHNDFVCLSVCLSVCLYAVVLKRARVRTCVLF